MAGFSSLLIFGVLFSLNGYVSPNPVVPYSDPVIATNLVPVLNESIRNIHPRLIVTSNSIPAVQALYSSPDGTMFRSDFDSYLPSCYTVPTSSAFLTDATQAQVQGLWRIPTVALNYLLTGNTNSFNAVVAHMKWLMRFPSWDNTSGEMDCGMGAGNMLVGAALAFDWLYNDLDPEFREEFRAKLWYQARAMYYAGHLKGASGVGYWTSDPQNNHRWHRDAGLALAVLAAYDGKPEKGWMLAKMLEELQFVASWLPEDGTSHESTSYLCFGGAHLTLALQASDGCLGTAFLQQDFFKKTPGFVLSGLTPQMPNILPYGDTGGEVANYTPYLWKAIAEHQLADEQAAMLSLYPTMVSWRNSFAWMSLVWYDASVSGGSITNLPDNSFWPDMGIAYTRTGWATNDAAAMFKCGPFGGYKLNDFRNANNYVYVNVAHDDPDANSFILFNDGELLAETDRYSYKKQSQNYNTILVNGIGQFAKGRTALPYQYSQPATGSTDMRTMGVVTAWLESNEVVAVEGEAAGSYLSGTVSNVYRSALSRFRRTFLWVENKYVLVLDDIRCPSAVDITWQMQGQNLTALNAPAGKYRLTKNSATCDFQVVADSAFSTTITNSLADNKNTLLGWKQLQAVKTGTTGIRFVSVYDLWGTGSMSVSLATVNSNQWTVAVTGNGINDTWNWQASSGGYAPSTLSALHQGNPVAFFYMNATNSVPPVP